MEQMILDLFKNGGSAGALLAVVFTVYMLMQRGIVLPGAMVDLKVRVATLEAEKAALERDIVELRAEIAGLKARSAGQG